MDELPTLYFHKIDRLIGTARSNKVAVTLGFQELPQLEADYGKVGMQKIITTCGNIFMGAARNKETLEWAQNDVFGKAKQTSRSVSINDHKVSTTISEKMDFLVPAAKIADMATGWLDRRHVTLRLPMTVCLTILTLNSRKSSGLQSISARRTLT